MPLRLAMWSGPRNISTAMMRAWGNRPDTVVVDEPLYAHYLTRAAVDHPGRDAIIAAHESDWRKVVPMLIGAIPDNADIFYQKHMSHHLLPMIDREWLDELTHAFLIRDPAEMLTSLAKVTPNPTLADTGLPQQVELFNRVRDRRGHAPPVVDARDVLTNPRGVLGELCDRVGVPFSECMLHWPAGRRKTDGIWAEHWYSAVEKSTGFEPCQPLANALPARLAALESQCREYYAQLHQHRITSRG